MGQDWGDWGTEDSGDDYHGDAAETANLGDPDEPLASGSGGYGEPDEGGDYTGGDGSGDGGGPDEGGQPGGGFLEDDPMGSFDTDGPDADGFGPDDAGDSPGDTAGPDAFDDDPAGDPASVVGADPDVDPDADWSPAEFPARLDFAAPEPVDGYPWSDPSAVAAPGTGDGDPATAPDGAPPAQDLLDYAGADGGGDPWAALVGSDDPATSSLGRWWSPG